MAIGFLVLATAAWTSLFWMVVWNRLDAPYLNTETRWVVLGMLVVSVGMSTMCMVGLRP